MKVSPYAPMANREAWPGQTRERYKPTPAWGGTCPLYRVGRDGIKAWDILEFADKVGAVADIADTGVDVLRPLTITI